MDDSSDDEFFEMYSTKSVTSNFEAQLQKVSASDKSGKVENSKKPASCVGLEVVESLSEKVVEKPTSSKRQGAKKSEDVSVISEPTKSKVDEVVEEAAPPFIAPGTRRSRRLNNVSTTSTARKESGGTRQNNETLEVVDLDDSYEEERTPSNSNQNSGRGRGRPKGRRGKRGRRGRGRGRKNNTPEVTEILDLSDNYDLSLSNIEEDEINCEVSVKVIWKSIMVKKFLIRKFQKLGAIFEYYMKEEGLPEDKLIFTLNNTKVLPTDTPDSLKLSIVDFIEGGVLSNQTSSTYSHPKPVQADKNSFHLKFQNSNKKIVPLTLSKGDIMRVVMVKYAEQIEQPLDKIKFLFDGEVVNPNETPETLGLETEEVIDVKVLT